MRSNRRREQRRKRAVRKIALAHVMAGDTAFKHYLYEDAAQHYQDALDVEGTSQAERSDILERLAKALALTAHPDSATPWFDQALASRLNNAAATEAEKTVEILLQRARQLWIDARTEASLPLIGQAIEIASETGNSRLCKLANSRMANYLMGLFRYEEAYSFLQAVGEVGNEDDATTRATYYTQRAILAGVAGEVKEAFEYFERALSAAKEDSDIFQLTNVWDVYATWANALGNIELAKSCCERALLAARRYHISWRISGLCLEYANLLMWTGQYENAYEYVLNAFSYNAHTSAADTLFAEVGIPLALHMKDKKLLARCTQTSVIDYAFRSGQPYRIGPVAAAFSQWYVSSGKEHEARRLLHRAITAFQNLKRVDLIWSFPLAVAQYGLPTDIPAARALLESRAALPCSDVVQAVLSLFDAFAAKRYGKHSVAQRYAENAAQRFEILSWHGYVDLAYTLFPTVKRTPVALREKPFSDLMRLLTKREQQVAELVLKGLTNHAIADMLAIKERTVEAHMTAILKHLGLRSRHQLSERFSRIPTD